MLHPEPAPIVWTVTELNQAVAEHLRDLDRVLVRGEVTNYSRKPSGQLMFNIGDGSARVQAVVWPEWAQRLRLRIEPGQSYVFTGRVQYWRSGQLVLAIWRVQHEGEGRIRALIDDLRRTLEAEGAFAAQRKRQIPFLPHTVGLITSPTGAVIHDLTQTIWERFPSMGILLYPVQVQGELAAPSLVAAISQANREREASVLVVARGGGGFEDLYAFNTEEVVRAIMGSAIPVVTALGHTSDRTLSDLVADAECRTPTEAGARVVPIRNDLERHLRESERRLGVLLAGRLQMLARTVESRAAQVAHAATAQVGARRARLLALEGRLEALRPSARLLHRRTELERRNRQLALLAERLLSERRTGLARRPGLGELERLAAARVRRAREELAHRTQRLEALSPDAVLRRGYSIALDEASGRVISARSQVAAGQRVRVRTGGGDFLTRVEDEQP